MNTTTIPERRTRSQISLSDDILKVPDHSPMKNARSIQRKHSNTPELSVVADSEDEMLLSPNLQTKPQRSKRSVSPATHGYEVGSSQQSEGRELKRIKRDSGAEGSMHNSEPTVPVKPSRKRAGTTSTTSNKPKSTSNSSLPTQSPPRTQDKSRARSVPLFPLAYPLPQLDLRNPPLSPIRARSPSRSPTKNHGLKVQHLPEAPAVSLPEDPKVPMEVDSESPSVVEPQTETPIDSAADDQLPPPPEVSASAPEPPTPGPSTTVLPPATPMISQDPDDPFSFPLSPLTPLPETPPSKAIGNDGEDRYREDGWAFTADKGSQPSNMPIPKPDFGKPKNTVALTPQSQIPRPTAMAPPTRFANTPLAVKPNQSSLRMTAHNGTTSTSKPNIFQLMMRNAGKSDATKASQDKGKGKLGSVFGFGSKTPIKATTLNSNAKGDGKTEQEVKKATLKQRMRPNPKDKSKPAPPSRFVPLVIDDDEEEEEAIPKSDVKPETKEQPTTAIVKKPEAEIVKEEVVPHSTETKDRLLSPVDPVLAGEAIPRPVSSMSSLTSLSKTSRDEVKVNEGPIEPQSFIFPTEPALDEANPFVSQDATLTATNTTAVETPQTPETQNEVPNPVDDAPITTEKEPAKPSVPLSQPLTTEEESAASSVPVSKPEEVAVAVDEKVVPPPAKGRPITRKRALSSLPMRTTRVTRSAVKPAPIPKPATTRRAVRPQPTRKPLPKKGKQASVSGTHDSSITEPEPQDSILDQGSPMQTSSPMYTPARGGFRTPGSSPAKFSLTKTPSKPNLSATMSPSPTKLARAVSMFSRPTAVDDIGVKPSASSLSTLSNALEKLKMPAPLRPNTSLGFNTTSGDQGSDDVVPAASLDEGQQTNDIQTTNSTTDTNMNLGIGSSKPHSTKQASTVGPGSSNETINATTIKSTTTSGSKPALIQKPMTAFFSKPGSSSSSTSTTTTQSQKPLFGISKPSIFGTSLKGKGKEISSTSSSLRGGGILGNRAKLFPMGNRRMVHKVSKKTSLPMVEASPVKGAGGGGAGDSSQFDTAAAAMALDLDLDFDMGGGSLDLDGHGSALTDVEDEGEKHKHGDGESLRGRNGTGSGNGNGIVGDLSDVFMVPITKETDGTGGIIGEKEKEKEKNTIKEKKRDSSRRASLASQALSDFSHSLSAAPAYRSNEKGTMGPPVTPKKLVRSVSSTYPEGSATKSSPSPSRGKDKEEDGKATPPVATRYSTRQAAKAAATATASITPTTTTIGSGVGGGDRTPISAGPSISAGKKRERDKELSKKVPESLKVLRDCVIFVDVRTDDGEEAGSLFVEMLEGLGAKILARVGQTCTHIIYKNGLMSTITRYRLLRDPKPSVVGIAWVVDCVEQRRRVEEEAYLIDLKEANIAGTNKRRRSMLPKLMSGNNFEEVGDDTDREEDGDVSMESVSSITLDDDLTPLERARRRRSMIFGPTT